jgi:hypothetical protein
MLKWKQKTIKSNNVDIKTLNKLWAKNCQVLKQCSNFNMSLFLDVTFFVYFNLIYRLSLFTFFISSMFFNSKNNHFFISISHTFPPPPPPGAGVRNMVFITV